MAIHNGERHGRPVTTSEFKAILYFTFNNSAAYFVVRYLFSPFFVFKQLGVFFLQKLKTCLSGNWQPKSSRRSPLSQEVNFATTLLAQPKRCNQKPINLIDSSVCIVAGCNEHHLRFGFPCNFSSNWQTECKKSKEVFFFAVIDLFPLRVRFSLLKCLLWEKHCNYLMTTTQGDRFGSCENIVSRSQNSSSPPPPPGMDDEILQ